MPIQVKYVIQLKLRFSSSSSLLNLPLSGGVRSAPEMGLTPASWLKEAAGPHSEVAAWGKGRQNASAPHWDFPTRARP